ncbi:MAG: sugar transferase [Acidobacteriota bacterium]|nr:sugar transferase [Acidobacteriota bacterium]
MKEKAKRTVDVVFSIIALTISLPIICLISILIYLTMGRPILFKQVRPGLGY